MDSVEIGLLKKDGSGYEKKRTIGMTEFFGRPYPIKKQLYCLNNIRHIQTRFSCYARLI